MKMRREENTTYLEYEGRKIREYKNYNNYSYIRSSYIYIYIYILTTSSKKTYEAYEVVFGIRVCYTCVYV